MFVSNTGMEQPNPTDHRLMDLEIKASFHEDLLDQLNQVIVRQQEEITALARQVGQLRLQIPDGSGATSGRPADELPPHY